MYGIRFAALDRIAVTNRAWQLYRLRAVLPPRAASPVAASKRLVGLTTLTA